MITVIGLIGLIGAGKTTTAQYLCGKHGFYRLRFADSLKNMLHTFGLSVDEIDGSKKNEPCEKLCGKTPRYAMQTLGTAWGRELIGQDVWVEALKRELLCISEINVGENKEIKINKFVIDDVRFKNEVRMLTNLTLQSDYQFMPYMIRLHRDNNREKYNHISENDLNEYIADYDIDNNGTIEGLYSTLDRMIGGLM